MKAPKLRHKGLIIVTLPVIFFLIFTTTLIVLLMEAESELKQETYAAKVIALSSSLSNLYYEGVYDSYLYHLSRSERMKERAQKCIQEIPKLENHLKELLLNSRHEAELFEETKDTGKKIRKILSEVVRGAPNDLAGSVDSKIFQRSVFHRLYTLNEKYADIIEHAKAIEKNAPKNSKQSRTLVMSFAFIGTIASVLLAIFSSVYFTRNITQRLDTISDNALRLARDASLNPPLQGDDEIASLDAVFHRMARLLEEADKKQKALVNNAVNVLASLDENLKFIEVSPASKKIWGHEPSELIGSRALNLFSNTDEASDVLNSLVLSKGEQTFDAVMTHGDGSTIYVRWDVHWSDSEKALFCVVSDITRETQLMRFKQQLIDTVAHDLRTPVTSIQNSLALISMGVYGEIPEKVEDMVVKIENQSQRLIRLINDLLDFERLESGRLSLALRNVDSFTLIDESISAVSGSLAQKNMTIDKPGESGSVVVDVDRIIQVMVNLLSNAIKFAPEKSRIELQFSKDGSHARFAVKDEGPGVPEEFHEQIFERFEMVGDERQKGKQGSGLGLSICKQIIELHGGTIGVTNNTAKGSTFYFTVPLEKKY